MTDLAIHNLPALTVVPSTAIVPVDDGTTTSKATVANFLTGGGAELARRPPASYTAASNDLALADAGKCVQSNRSTAIGVRIRTQANIAWLADTLHHGINLGAGTLTVSVEAGATLNGVSGGSVTVAQHGWWWAKRIGADAWQAFTGGTSTSAGGGGIGFRFTYSTTTTDADPGAGTLRGNNATLSSVTQLYVDLAEYGGTDVTTWLDSLDDYAGTIKGVIRLSSQSDPTKWIEYTMTAWTTATGYRKLTVAYKAGPGGLLTVAGDTFFAFDYATDGAGSGFSAPAAAIVITGNADSHSGLAARDGVTPIAGTVVYDVGHATTASRGYWLAASGAWTRPSYYDADADVVALLGALVFITGGTVGAGTSWQQLTGTTIAGAKTFRQLLGNPDTVVGENLSVTELGHDEGAGTGRLYSGSRYIKDISTTIASGATATIWSFDGAALGLSAGDLEAHSPNVLAWWAADSTSFWGTKALLAVHGTPPTLTDTKAQIALDTVGGGAGAYLTLAWDLSGNVIRLRARNNRPSACSVVVTNNYLCAQMV